LYDKEMRIEIEFPGLRKEMTPSVVRFVSDAPRTNFVLYSRLDESNADAVIQDQVDFFTPLNQPFTWDLFDHDTPPDLRQRLAAHGFDTEDEGALMVLDLQDAPATLLKPVSADVRRILQRDGLEDVIQVEEQVWQANFGWIRKIMGDNLEIPGYLSVYVAYVENRPACAGWTYFYPNSHFAGLFGGSTLPEYRQGGLYTAVLALRVQEAIQRGYPFLSIDAMPMSRAIVKKYNFQHLDYTHNCEWKGSPNPQV
jgi:hypothetical protein